MLRAMGVAVVVAGVFSLGCKEKMPSGDEAQASVNSAAKAAPASKAPVSEAAPVSKAVPASQAKNKSALPGSERVFAVSLDGGTTDHLLGTEGDALWAATLGDKPGEGHELWRVKGPGVVQRVVAGDFGHGHKLYVARGVGRGFLSAPLVLQELDPKTGAATELWRHAGPRNECAHLSIADVDQDGKPELAFAYYASKYTVTTRHLEADGGVHPGEEVRMASSRTYGDLNGDGRVDEAVGRVYGDAKGEPGDLKVNLGKGWVKIPTDNGVRAVLIAQLAGDKSPQLYFADGWVSNTARRPRPR